MSKLFVILSKTMCLYYILEFKSTNLHLWQVELGAYAKIEIVIDNQVCSIVGHCYYSFQALSYYILFNARQLRQLQQLLTFEINQIKIRITNFKGCIDIFLYKHQLDQNLSNQCFFVFFQRSTFVGSAWSFRFSIPATTANDLRLRRIFYPRFYPLHLFSCLNF